METDENITTENAETVDSTAIEAATIDTTDQKIDELQSEIDNLLNDL